MSQPITVHLEQSRRFDPGDTARLRIDGIEQPDRIQLWGPERAKLGWGKGRWGAGRWGTSRSLGWGTGVWGLGRWGQGARLLERDTAARFVAGDYTLESRAVDSKGNAGAWGSPVLHAHRPTPPTPAITSVSPTLLAWTWADG